MRNHSRWGFALGNTSNRDFRPTRVNNAQPEPIMPNATPNTYQWNMVRDGYARVGFALFVSFFRVGYAHSTQREGRFQWNMDESCFLITRWKPHGDHPKLSHDHVCTRNASRGELCHESGAGGDRCHPR